MAWVLGIILLAALVRGTFGFGDALVAMPPLVLLLGSEVAAPLVALLSAVIGSVIVVQDWRHVRFREAGVLIVSALPGIVGGLLFLGRGSEQFVSGLLGSVLILFALYSLFHPHMRELKSNRWAPLFGVTAGVLSGAYNAPGPPLVIYGALRRWNAAHFRATLQAFFLPTALSVVLGHAVAGRLTPLVLKYFAAGIPLLLVSLWAGRWINKRFTTATFQPALYILLLLLGAALLVRACW